MNRHSRGNPGKHRSPGDPDYRENNGKSLKLISGLISFVFLIFIIAGSAPCAEQSRRLFRIGTGGLSGVYYPIGKLIAQGITDLSQKGELGLPGLIGVAQSSGGSVANIRALASGEIEAGLVQADVASWALKSEHLFSDNKNVSSVRAIASLYPESFQIVTRRDANIRSVPELRGKHISIDEIGSGTLSVMKIVLQAHGLTEKDLYPAYLKPDFAFDEMVGGKLQGFVAMAGVPMKAITRVADIGIFMVPISPEIAGKISDQYPYLVPGRIPAGVYRDVPETPTLQVHALLVVSAKLPENFVYKITAALWSEHTVSLLYQGHPQGKALSLKTALEGISIPLHPGAAKFYQEHGMSTKSEPTQ